MNCDWCGSSDNKVNVTRYTILGQSNGHEKKTHVNLCDSCSAWGVLSENWYGLDERIGIMTGVDYDYDDDGGLLISIE